MFHNFLGNVPQLFQVMFHNYYEPALIDEYGLALTPGTENFISLSYERVRSFTFSGALLT